LLSDRQPDAQFAGSLDNQEAHHSVDPDQRQQQRHAGECRQQPAPQPLLSHRIFDDRA